jgi:two-component system sensor histidine kinase KdpD
MADSLRAEWIVAYVETPAHARLSQADRAQIAETLRLSEQLGAETVTLTGHRISEEILAYARTRNVSKIIVGKPAGPLWKRILVGSIVDSLVRGSGDIDVYVMSGEKAARVGLVTPIRPRPTGWAAYGRAVASVALCTAVAWAMFPFFDLSNLIMVYLLGVVGVAAQSGRGPSIAASVLSVAAFDFFFVPPFYTFAVTDTQYFVTFGIMFVVALVISGLTVRIRWLGESARHRERRTAALYAMSRELATVRGAENILSAATRHIAEVFRSQVVVLLPDESGRPTIRAALPPQLDLDTTEQGVSQWVYEHRQMAGLGTGTLPGAKALYLPLVGSRGTAGVLGVRPAEPRALEGPEQLHQLETFATLTALAIERVQLAEEAQRAQVSAEAERLRNALLSSVSHDLRTPLATIMGAASSLLEDGTHFQRGTWSDLLQSIVDEAERLNRLVGNLLDMTRLEAGTLAVKKDWLPLEEVVGTALARLGKRLGNHPVTIHVPSDLPLVQMDGILVEQVLINLLDNGVKYTPRGSEIDISGSSSNGSVLIEVADRGPGFGPGEEARVFDKFYRGQTADSRGVGLGLAICRAIVEAHGGKIWAENRPGGGAVFRFTLPAKEVPPEIPDGV